MTAMPRSDKTLKTVQILRLGTLSLLLALLLFGLILNIDKINGDDFKRLGARISYGFGGELPTAENIAFTDGESLNVVPYKDGVGVVADDRLKVYDSTGMEFFNTQLVMNNPSISATARLLLVFDRGEKALAVYNSFSEVHRHTMPFSIIDAALSESGALIVAHKAEGYKSQLTVYGTNYTERYKWYAANTYITGVDVFGMPTRFACAGLTLDEQGLYCEVILFEPSSDAPQARVRLDGSFVYFVKFIDKNIVACATDSGYYIIECKTGDIKYSGQFDQNAMACYDFNDGYMAFAFSGRSSAGYAMIAVDCRTGREQRHHFPAVVESVAVYGAKSYVLTAGQVLEVQQGGTQVLDDAATSEYRIDTSANGRLMVFTKRAVRYCET